MKSNDPLYQGELQALRDKIVEHKVSAFENMKGFVQLDSDPKTCGYKSIEDALVKIMKHTLAKIEKDIRAFERKHPD